MTDTSKPTSNVIDAATRFDGGRSRLNEEDRQAFDISRKVKRLLGL